ncbi:MAG: hypothetical protein PF637_06150 [Spirochaetes bacterium]|nr:hypothetical protein [Spirochaetota bacterium]
MRYNKQIIRHLLKTSGKKSIKIDYFLYCVCRLEFAKRSGLFNIDDLVTVLHEKYGFKSLHNRPGNAKACYREKYLNRLRKSVLFTAINESTFRFNSQKKILRLINKHFCTEGIEIDPVTLQNRKDFVNIVLGQYMDGSRFKGYKKMSEETGFSMTRIFDAAKSNHENGYVQKQNNFILYTTESFRTKKLADWVRAEFWKYHRIFTPEPVRIGREFYILLYAPNSYCSKNVDQRLNRRPNQPIFDNNKSWLKNIDSKFRNSYRIPDNIYMVNDSVFSLSDYFSNYGEANYKAC